MLRATRGGNDADCGAKSAEWAEIWRAGDALGHLRCDDDDAGVGGGARDVARDVIAGDLPRLSATPGQ